MRVSSLNLIALLLLLVISVGVVSITISGVQCNEQYEVSSTNFQSTTEDLKLLELQFPSEDATINNHDNSFSLLKKLISQIVSHSNTDQFEKIEKLIRKVLPNYLVQSLSPVEYRNQNGDDSGDDGVKFESNFHFETNYQYSKSTDEYATFNIITKQEQSLILFILGTATRTFTDIFGNDFINQPENIYLKNLVEFSDQENYEKDLIRLKVKLFFKEVERNIKEGDSKEKIGWLFKQHYKRFNSDLFDFDSQLFTNLYPLMNDCSNTSVRGVLFVGGLYTDWYPFYFDGLRKYLSNCGLVDFRISQVDTGKGVESNAEFLKNEIVKYYEELNSNERTRSINNQHEQDNIPSLSLNNENKESELTSSTLQKILIIGHSKGACDATYALAKYENELKPYVRGLISLQAPYAGSALANDISEFGASKILLLKILIEDVLGGELKAIEDMSYNERMEQVKQYPYPSSTFPCVAMSSYEDSPNSLLYPAISYLKARYNVSNDGLVPTMDGYIPGCKNVIIKNMDHSGSAFTGFPNLSKYDPAQLSLTFIHMWNHFFTKH